MNVFALFGIIISIAAMIISDFPANGWCVETGEKTIMNQNDNRIKDDKPLSKSAALETATFAGGCFWCMEAPFEEIEGVKSVVSGYTGGHTKNPTYEQVCSGTTGHLEAVQIEFDPLVVSYEKLLDVFWMQIDPTDDGGSFVDRGSQYKSAIFYHNELQKKSAQESKEKLQASGKFNSPIATKLIPFSIFYPAEEYHQDYYKKSSMRYKMYRVGSGRDAFINKTWNSNE